MRWLPLLLMLWPWALAQAQGPMVPHDVELTQLRVREGGPWYTLAIIRPVDGPLLSGDPRHRLALRLGEAAQLFRVRNYRERHPEWAADYVDPSKDFPLDGRTTVIAIFE